MCSNLNPHCPIININTKLNQFTNPYPAYLNKTSNLITEKSKETCLFLSNKNKYKDKYKYKNINKGS